MHTSCVERNASNPRMSTAREPSAALPLVKDKSRWPLTVFRLPSNCTVGSGDLLIDPTCDVDAVTQAIARQIVESSKIDLVLGGGTDDFLPESKGGHRRDERVEGSARRHDR